MLNLITILTVFRMVFIPAQFKDCSFDDNSLDNIQNKVQLCQDYYNQEFRGIQGFESFSFELAPIVTLPQTMSYYAYNYSDRKDVLLYQALKEACTLSTEIDYKQFDNNSNSEVNIICVIFSGQDEIISGNENAIYPQYLSLKNFNTSLRLKACNIDKFIAVSENSGYGIICHELAHYWGLPDFYDTDYESSNGISFALGSSSLMDEACKRDGGNNPPTLTALEYDVLGLGQCLTMTTAISEIPSFSKERQYLKAENANNPNEYYLFDYEEDEGLRIFYVDKSNNPRGFSTLNKKNLTAQQRWECNEINANPNELCAKKITIKSNSFGSDTDMPFRFFDNTAYQLAIINIEANKFNIIEPIVLKEVTVFQDAAIIRWDYASSFQNPIIKIYWDTENSATINDNKKYFAIESLKSNTDYNFSIKLIVSDIEAYSINSTFHTKVYHKSTKPYIYLSSTQRNINGSFPLGAKIPLRIYNVQNIVSTKWFFNSHPIITDSDGYFVVREEGILKAEIEYEDGNREIIIKEIKL